LTTLIELANDEASVLGREYGLELSATGYRFVEFDPLLNRWYEIIGDELLRPRELEPGIEFDLFIEDRRVLLENELITLTPAEPEPEQGDDEDEQVERRDDKESKLLNDYEPHVLIMSSGDVSPFELRILQPDKRYEMTLTMSLAGELEMTDNNDDFR
jgi:general secretion pathway protein H